MMPAPASTHETIATLEQLARDHEQQSQQCREAAETLRRVFGLTAKQELTAAPPAAVTSSQSTRVSQRGSRAAAITPTLETAILEALGTEDLADGAGTIDLRRVCRLALRDPKLKVKAIQGAVEALLAAGRITRRGDKFKIAAAGKTPAPKSTTPSTPRPMASPIEALAERLLAGPFKDPTATFSAPQVQVISGANLDQVLGALGTLLRANRVTLLSVGSERLYRRVA